MKGSMHWCPLCGEQMCWTFGDDKPHVEMCIRCEWHAGEQVMAEALMEAGMRDYARIWHALFGSDSKLLPSAKVRP